MCTCISRIAELSSLDVSYETSESSFETEALKIYLGQILPMSGKYDVFLSYKSEDYLKSPWVKDEWSTFNNEIREGRKNGNLILLLSDDIEFDKGRLPGQLRQKEIIKMSEFRSRLLSYLR